jgi:hypothetical protein
MKKNGKYWVIGLLGLGCIPGLVAVTYWKSPPNSVRWSFTQIHTSLVRGKKDAAVRFLAPTVTYNGKDLSAAEFMSAYSLDRQTDEIETTPCASTPAHMTVTMSRQVYCFEQVKSLWRLHLVGAPPCSCK